MIDQIAWPLATITCVATIVIAAMRGWRGWLELKRAELRQQGEATARAPAADPRIELAALRERVRRLEAIAQGVDL